MKKTISVLLAFLITMLPISVFAALKPLDIYADGEKIDFERYSHKDFFVPMRDIFEKLGYTVTYEEINGEKTVTATNDGRKVSLIIGSTSVTVNDTQISLDIAPIIVNDRTLVPLDLISKALGCSVEWNEGETILYINTYGGQYIITNSHIEKDITAADGTILATIKATYPVLHTGTGYPLVEYVNSEYKQNAEKFVTDTEAEYKDYASDLYNQLGDMYRTMAFELSYYVTSNRMDILSITNEYYYDAGGAHPFITRSSRSFEDPLNTELSLKDFLHSAPEDTGDLIYNLFVENFFKKVEQEHGIPFTEEDSQNLKKEISNVQFFVRDNGITLYFNPYQVAPYALGFPTVEIPCEQLPDSFLKADLSTAKCESLTFDLNANPTTGYSWKFDVSENISLNDEYISEDMYSSCTAFNTNVGKGGIQRFTVTGLKEGNGTVCAYYYRPWEDKSTATRVKTYKFYVDENLLITLIAEEDPEALGFLD